MKVESAIELQARIFREVFDFQPLDLALAGADDGLAGAEILVDPVVFASDTRAARARRSEKHKALEDIALGVSEVTSDGGVRRSG